MTIYKEAPTTPVDSDDDILERIDAAIIRETKEVLKASFVRHLTDEEIEYMTSVFDTYAMTADDYFKLVESFIPEEPISIGAIYEIIEHFARE